MRLEIKDLPIEVQNLLPKEFTKWNDDMFLTFWYEYDDSKSRIIDIKQFEKLSEITLFKYGTRPYSSIGLGLTLGFFKMPLLSQNSLLYQFLYYYVQNDKEAVKQLKEAYKEFKRIDLEDIETKLKNTKFNNVFEIYNRKTFSAAISRYLYVDNEVKTNIESIFDTLDYYFRRRNANNSFYGGCLEKIVTAMKHPNGGLISDTGAKLRYLYIGQHSERMNNFANQEHISFEKAKLMMRQKLTYAEIFAVTGWYFNTFDNKWRLKISDKDAKIPALKAGEFFIKKNSLFLDKKDKIHGYVTDKDHDVLSIYVKQGWDVMLGDVLQHPTLYKHYPQLYNVPIFYAIPTDIYENNFYYSPDANYLMMYGHPTLFDIKTVMLHEAQHKIQAIENYGKGGNKDFIGKMIQAIGGEKVKEYFFIKSWNERAISLEAKPNGKYSYEEYRKVFAGKSIKGAIIYSDAESYYANIDDVSDFLERVYLNNPMQNLAIDFIANNGVLNNYIIIKSFMDSNSSANAKLRAMGLSDKQISDAKFNSYEYLLGEVESRDVQHSSMLDDEIGYYVLPLTSEGLEGDKVTVLSKFDGEEMVLPKKYKGAVEKTDSNYYIIHLFESTTCEPLLHELGHIVCDFMGREYVFEKIIRSIDSSIIDSFGGLEEVFCELFLCFIYKLNLSETIGYQLEDRKLIDETFLDLDFKDIFLPTESHSADQTFGEMGFFVTMLNEVIQKSELIDA